MNKHIAVICPDCGAGGAGPKQEKPYKCHECPCEAMIWEDEVTVTIWIALQQIRKLHDKNRRMRKALQKLLSLKHMKDEYGKIPAYLEQQPEAWNEVARILLEEE